MRKKPAPITSERKAEIINAIVCVLIFLVLIIVGLIYWERLPNSPKKNSLTAQLQTSNNTQNINSQDLVGSYKENGQLLKLKKEATAELSQDDWANPLTGFWFIDDEQQVIVEIPLDQNWRKRTFKYIEPNLIDKQSNQSWRKQ